jgi:ribonuclease D
MSEVSDPNRRKRRDPRFSYRDRAHASAHAAAEAHRPAAIPEDPHIPRKPGQLIDTPGALAELVEHLRAVGSFAYDSEFIGEMSYHPRLCLIQVATRDRIGLVDPLAEMDLGILWRLIADPAIEKIVHAGQQDLEPVQRHLDALPANIFDTQVAAGFAGLAYPVGLSKLVRELIDVSLPKGFTFTHWDQRPLSGVQLRYAADDVRYLPALRARIGQRLEALGHLNWARAESLAMCDPSLFRVEPQDQFRRMRGAKTLSPRNAAVLRELVIWREGAARRNDTPPRSYLRDEVLLEMARNPVTHISALDRVKGLPRPVESAEGENLIEATQRGMATPAEDLPVIEQNEETPTERFGSDALWASAQAWCHSHGIDPGLVTSRAEISQFYRRFKAGDHELTDHRLMSGWRADLLGRPLLDFIAGRHRLTINWHQCAASAQR